MYPASSSSVDSVARTGEAGGVRRQDPFRTVVTAWVCSALSMEATGALGAEPLGAERCGACHASIYESWKQTAHARSMESLSPVQQRDKTCRNCHTLAPDKTDSAFHGVQCESCHGYGSQYAPNAVMREPQLARMLGLVDVTVETCRACHEGVGSRLRPYDFSKMLKASHPEASSPKAEP